MERQRRGELIKWINVASFAVLVALAGTGLVLHWVLPPGSGPSRHTWRDLHAWLALGFLGLVSLHLSLHWGWVRVNVLGSRSLPRRWVRRYSRREEEP